MVNMFLYLSAPVQVAYDNGLGNDNGAYVPEHWALESLMILEESVVATKLVHNDFSPLVQNIGDIVNTRRPQKFYSSRKTDQDDVEEEDAVSVNVQIPLDQHHYKSFIIKDGEGAKSFKELVSTYLRPAIQAVGRGVDRTVSGQMHRFIGSPAVGTLGGLTPANVQAQIVEAGEKLDLNNVPDEDRYLLLSPSSRSALLNTELFVSVNKADDGGAALRKAQIAELFNFDIFQAKNVPCITDSSTDVASGTVTGAVAADAAPVSQAVTITGYEVVVGEFAVVAGNDQPQYITAATTGVGDTTAVTLDSANVFDSGAGAAIKVYQASLAAAAYGVGYAKEIAVDGWTNAPQAGQMIATGTGASRKMYTVIESRVNPLVGTEQLLLLDRPLETAIADNEAVFPGPAGCFNLAFHRNAIAFVNRPLPAPNAALGAMGAVVNYEGMSMRVVMQYDSKKQGTRVTCDMLTGVQLLDPDMACLFLG